MGLLLSHKCTIIIRSDMVEIHRASSGSKGGGGKRDAINGFTRTSRKRLIELMHTLVYDEMTMVTLTYPEHYPVDWKVYKAHLRAFRAQLERKFGKLRVVWRLEFQKRGAPHYHLLVLDPPYIDAREWSMRWAKITKSGDEIHAKIGVDVKPVSEWGDRGLVAFYVSKYAAKTKGTEGLEDGENTGRHWGKWNIKEEPPIELEMDDRSAERFCSELLDNRGDNSTWEPTDRCSCTIFGNRMGSRKFESFALRFAKKYAVGQK